MDKIEVYALDDDGNRIEPQQEVEQKEEEVSQEVLNQETPEQVKEENELPQQEEESSKGQEQEQVEEEDQEKLLTEEPEKDDNWFLSRLKDRYEVELNSIDDLKNVLSNTDKEKENLPEDVEKYMEFRKETGRSFSDFAELQKDWATVGDGDILRQYYEQTKPHLDREDIEHILNEQFSYDQEIDDDKDIRATRTLR